MDKKESLDASSVTLPAVLVLSSGGAIDPNGPLATSPPQLTTLGQQAIVTIPSASLLALNPTGVTLVPSPGANKYYVITGILASVSAGTAYTVPQNNCNVYYGSATGPLAWTNSDGFRTALQGISTNSSFVTAVGSTTLASSLSAFANQPLVFALSSGSITTGTGTLTLTVNYQTHTFPN